MKSASDESLDESALFRSPAGGPFGGGGVFAFFGGGAAAYCSRYLAHRQRRLLLRLCRGLLRCRARHGEFLARAQRRERDVVGVR